MLGKKPLNLSEKKYCIGKLQFHLKTSPFLRYLNFCPDFLAHITHIKYILPNTSRSEGNQTMKFGQLIEYNMTNIFLEKSSTECDEETSPRPFSKKLKLSISLYQKSEILCSLFLLYVQVGA